MSNIRLFLMYLTESLGVNSTLLYHWVKLLDLVYHLLYMAYS